ncbi:MAG: VWA domain-containing protein [Roseicyclus sp.]
MATRGPSDGEGRSDPQPVVAFGRPVGAQIDRIRALVAGELSPEDAALFARPPQNGEPWLSESGRPLVALSAVDGPRRQQLEAAHAAAVQRIRGLADRLEPRGEAGRVAAHILRCALVVPDGLDGRHTDGAKPILAFWGMARPGQDLPVFAAVAAPMTTGPSPSGPAGAAMPLSGGGAPDADVTEPAGRPAGSQFLLLVWALPLALVALGLWLLVQVLQPLPPVIVERPGSPTPPAVDPTVEPAMRVALLEQALAEARGLADRLGEACVVPPEPAEPRGAEVAPPLGLPPESPSAEARVDPPPPVLPVQRPRDVPPPPVAASPVPPPAASAPRAETSAPSVCDPGWRPGRTPRVIFVVDGSGSMRAPMPGAGSRMEASKAAIGRATRALHSAIEVGMVSFSHCGATNRSRFYAHPEREAFLGQVRALTPQRATSLAASIARAGATAPRTSEVMMVVVSDGEDTCGGDPCAAARQVRAQKPNLTINVIDLGRGAGAGVLQCVASAGGGRVFTPRDVTQMNANLQRATGHADASGCP